MPAVTLQPQSPALGRWALVVLCGTVLVSVTSASMATVTLPALQADFDVTADTLSWVVSAYLITFAAGTVIYGRLADMHGTKRMYIFGMTLFALASLAVGLAPTFWTAVAARAAQGFGGTAVPALSMATIVRTTSPEARGRALGATILAVGVGFAIGPLAGGALTEWASWRAPFVASAVVALAILPIAVATVPNLPGRPGQRFDYLGAFCLVGAVTGDLLALNRLPRQPGDVLGLVGLAASIPLWAGLVLRVWKAPDPFIHRRVAASPRFMGLSAVGFACQGSHFAVIVLLPLLFAQHHGLSVIQIGLHLVPGALALAFFGIAGGALANRLGNALLLVSGTSLMLLAATTFHVAGVAWDPWNISALYLVLAAGYGMVNAAVANSATRELTDDLAGVGVGVFNLMFFMGGATSVALAGSILRSRVTAAHALDPIFSGQPAEFSDAMLVVVGFTAIALTLVTIFAPRRRSGRVPGVVASLPVERDPSGASATGDWTLQPRAKPNTGAPPTP